MVVQAKIPNLVERVKEAYCFGTQNMVGERNSVGGYFPSFLQQM